MQLIVFSKIEKKSTSKIGREKIGFIYIYIPPCEQERETNLSTLLCNFEKEVEEMRGEKAAREEEITQLKVEVADLTADLTATEKDDVEKQASIDGLTGQLVELELKTNNLETELEEKKDSLAELLQTFLAQQQDLERVQQEKLAAEESSSKKDDLVTDLQTKLDELKMSREEIEESLLDTQAEMYKVPMGQGSLSNFKEGKELSRLWRRV